MRKAESCRTLLFSAEDGSPGAEETAGGGERGAAPAAEPPMRTKSAQAVRRTAWAAPRTGAETFYFSGAFMV